MKISASGNTEPSYNINICGTSLETKDFEFIKALSKSVDSTKDCADALQYLMEDFKSNWNTYSWTNLKRKGDDNTMFNFNFGPCGDRAKISYLGVAVKNAAKEWVSYDKANNEIVNVDLISFGNGDYVYMMPVALKDIETGDAIIHNGHVMFVKSVKQDYIQAIDVTAGEIKRIMPTKNMFGFDFITKIVSLIDMGGISASEDNPFGNMLPFLLLGENKSNDVLPLVMMMNGNQLDMSNPLTIMMLMKDRPLSNNLLPLIFMMNLKKEN